jgi:hypothetical protein
VVVVAGNISAGAVSMFFLIFEFGTTLWENKIRPRPNSHGLPLDTIVYAQIKYQLILIKAL